MTPTGSEPATFVFADIAGFTALAEAHGDAEAADVVAEFLAAVNAELPAVGTFVKTIGDAAMLRIPDPAEAILLGIRLTRDVLRRHEAPAIRVGLHHGPAIERDGDYIGTAVNVAARVAAVARGGEVLVTGNTAARAPDLEGVYYEARGRHVLRNLRDPVELFAAVPLVEKGGARLPVDPVCGMAVDPDRSAGRLVYDGAAYFFCTLTCAADFAQEPERFVGEGPLDR